MLNIFVTGSDINVGKNFITAGLAATMQSLGYQTCVYKPVETGAAEKNGFSQSPDLVFVKSIDPYIKVASSYLLKSSSEPCIAAEEENIKIDKSVIKKDYEQISKEVDCLITEGIGGVMTPVGINFYVSDIIKELNLPVVVVVKPSLNVINQTLLTINHAKEKGLNVRGVIINNFYSSQEQADIKHIPRLIEEYSGAKIVGVLQSLEQSPKIDPNSLITNILNGIDIESVFDVKISKLEVE